MTCGLVPSCRQYYSCPHICCRLTSKLFPGLQRGGFHRETSRRTWSKNIHTKQTTCRVCILFMIVQGIPVGQTHRQRVNELQRTSPETASLLIACNSINRENKPCVVISGLQELSYDTWQKRFRCDHAVILVVPSSGCIIQPSAVHAGHIRRVVFTVPVKYPVFQSLVETNDWRQRVKTHRWP